MDPSLALAKCIKMSIFCKKLTLMLIFLHLVIVLVLSCKCWRAAIDFDTQCPKPKMDKGPRGPLLIIIVAVVFFKTYTIQIKKSIIQKYSNLSTMTNTTIYRGNRACCSILFTKLHLHEIPTFPTGLTTI